METKIIADVIGEPETWPNAMGTAPCGIPDMRGAVITGVLVSKNNIAVQTRGAACGETFSVFAIRDERLRKRTASALKVGTEVYEAVDAPLT